MAKNIKPISVKQPTKEQMEEQAKRAFLQKRASLAEIILSNSLHGVGGSRINEDGKPDFKPAVDAAIEAADYMMEKLYGVSVKGEE